MATNDTFSTRRLDNIKRNQELLEGLGVIAQATAIQASPANSRLAGEPAAKRRRVEKAKAQARRLPTRTSARVAAASTRPSYNEDGPTEREEVQTRKSKPGKQHGTETPVRVEEGPGPTRSSALPELDELQASWSSWAATAPPPTRHEAGVFHFASHPDFTPNKSPSEVLSEGAFGGSYFRPLYSKKLGITISNDYLELPASWTGGLNVSQYLASPTYNPEANKFKVACGQSIEEWEANGWIDHRFDVRGWFQWYCRFFMGRRCDDDERQVSRWKRCVGPTGRWRRMLLKKYLSAGVTTVWDDGEDEDIPEVSPVMHQTCHHWAFEITQDVLDEYRRTGR